MAKEKKYCKVCGKELCKKNKSGYCNSHRDRTGANNSFFGKSHSKETIEKLKVKCAVASKSLWENDDYRNKVITNATGLKRGEDFKETQRRNAYKQFQDKKQREIRSKKMKETWESGNIEINRYPSINRSKKELLIMNRIQSILGEDFELYKTIHYLEKGKSKWLFPDGFYQNIIIEYNGDYWHANPCKYKESDIVHHGISAKTIWEKDKEKEELYNSLGYKVIYIWEKDYKDNPDLVIENVINKIKELTNDRTERKIHKCNNLSES